jgi:hypothetical protein
VGGLNVADEQASGGMPFLRKYILALGLRDAQETVIYTRNFTVIVNTAKLLFGSQRVLIRLLADYSGQRVNLKPYGYLVAVGFLNDLRVNRDEIWQDTHSIKHTQREVDAYYAEQASKLNKETTS